MEELERGKFERENRLVVSQQQRVDQQIALDNQGWRAPIQALAAITPLLLGLGFLLLAWRVADRIWPPPPRAARIEEPFEDDDEL